MATFSNVFKSVRKCAFIGMIHAKALPGTPKSKFSVQEIVEKACDEAKLYSRCGVDGVLVENMFDIPYVKANECGPEIISVMTRICSEVKKVVNDLPCGVQILAGNNTGALAVALASGFQFIRAEGFVFSHVSDEGIIDACAGPLLRYRKSISAEKILVFTDIKKKHSSHSITSDISLSETAEAAEFFLSDGVIVTGTATGHPPSLTDFQSLLEKKLSIPIIVGSGATVDNIENFISASAVIVGSHFKHHSRWQESIDSDKVLHFMEKVENLRKG